MDGFSLKARAISFAFSIGAVAFILAMLAGLDHGADPRRLAISVIVALICGVMSWAAAENAIAGIAAAVDAAAGRVIGAAQGDLSTPTPAAVGEALPDLAEALDGMFRQVRANLDAVHALAMFDSVTGLANRTSFRREADRMLRALPGEGDAALFFIDLDHFKAVNDTLGHAQGDQMLGMVANRLRAIATAEAQRAKAGAEPLVGRLAGDEFTLLFPESGGADGAARIGRALLAALNEPFEIAGQSLIVGASIGIALRPDHARTLTALMRAADAAMYHAKSSGRGQLQLYSDGLGEAIAGKVRLENDLRGALDRDEFALLLQPQVSLGDGQVVATEVLLRWNHPDGVQRLPDAFLATAEDSGLIIDIGNWAIEAVAAMAERFPRSGAAPRLAVNLSPRQIVRADFFVRLRDALARHKIPLNLLEFELTETVAMACGDPVIAEIGRLRADGARIAIDDFGAGHSNLSRLRRLPLDRIKIDESLIAGIADDAGARGIVHAVVNLIHGLGCDAVAEGVETDAQLGVLRVIGCDAVQGYAIAKPMTEGDYLSWADVARSAIAL
ncbi:MAG: bifunctional diguanylate cyclase/phosphodiesterase [Sphingomonadaceae bacterium]|nr:bifunctional diguanylate cyclase/phosphodiesterase [Sphingomonadaceae bacterium]